MNNYFKKIYPPTATDFDRRFDGWLIAILGLVLLALNYYGHDPNRVDWRWFLVVWITTSLLVYAVNWLLYLRDKGR